MTERNFRWGILGPGRIAQKFASALPYSKGGFVAAVASRDNARADRFASDFKAMAFYNYKELLQSGLVNAVYVATPHPYHLDLVLLALENKIPVLCEKPMGLNAVEVNQMVQASKANKTFLMEGMWTRFLPHIIKAKALIESGEIGIPKILQADFGINLPFDANARHYNLELGGGALIDIGIYPLFLGKFLFGEPENFHALATKSPTGSDESVAISLQYPNGVLGSLYASYQAQGNVEAEIIGTKGKLKILSNWLRLSHLEVTKDEKTEKIEFPIVSNGFQFEADEVMQCVLASKIESPAYSHAFSLEMAKLMDAMRRQFGLVYPQEK